MSFSLIVNMDFNVILNVNFSMTKKWVVVLGYVFFICMSTDVNWPLATNLILTGGFLYEYEFGVVLDYEYGY